MSTKKRMLVTLIVGVAGVAAVNHQIALFEQLGKLIDGCIGWRACWHHNPNDARSGERRHERFERINVATGLQAQIETDNLMTVRAQTLDHVSAHTS